MLSETWEGNKGRETRNRGVREGTEDGRQGTENWDIEQRTGDKEQRSETWNRRWETKGGKQGTEKWDREQRVGDKEQRWDGEQWTGGTRNRDTWDKRHRTLDKGREKGNCSVIGRRYQKTYTHFDSPPLSDYLFSVVRGNRLSIKLARGLAQILRDKYPPMFPPVPGTTLFQCFGSGSGSMGSLDPDLDSGGQKWPTT